MTLDDDATAPGCEQVLHAPAGWHKSPRHALHWAEWGADSVVYDGWSGRTHQFPPLAAAVMACFEEQPCTLPDLAAQLGLQDTPDLPLDDEVRLALRSVVNQFCDLGWIEPAPLQ